MGAQNSVHASPDTDGNTVTRSHNRSGSFLSPNLLQYDYKRISPFYLSDNNHNNFYVVNSLLCAEKKWMFLSDTEPSFVWLIIGMYPVLVVYVSFHFT